MTIMHNSQYTYLNSGLLWTPCEYVLHGLALGVYLTRLWPLLTSMHLVAMPNPVYTVYDNGSSFTQMSSAIWVASH